MIGLGLEGPALLLLVELGVGPSGPPPRPAGGGWLVRLPPRSIPGRGEESWGQLATFLEVGLLVLVGPGLAVFDGSGEVCLRLRRRLCRQQPLRWRVGSHWCGVPVVGSGGVGVRLRPLGWEHWGLLGAGPLVLGWLIGVLLPWEGALGVR